VIKNTNQQDRNDHHKVMKPAEEEWDQTNTRLAKYGQNSERTSDWNYQLDIICWDVSKNMNYQSDIVWVKSDNICWDRTLSTGRSLDTCFSPKVLLFLPKFDSWGIGHQIRLNLDTMVTSTQRASSDFGWTKKPRFWGKEEKSMKSKRLEPWIHSKVGGSWWGSS
jgi:hypothetical protein